jgi:hypothetical protein
MNELKIYLRVNVELSEIQIEETIGNHIKVLEKIDKKNKKKAEAAINEDFELAAKYKK